MSRLSAALCLVLAMSFTGANVPIGKVVVTEVPVLAFLALRFAVASLALALLVRREPGPTIASFDAADWRDAVWMSLVGSVLFTFFMLEGAKRTAAADAGLIAATIPAAVTIMGALIRRRWPRPRELATVLLACSGLAVMQVGVTGGSSSAVGNALVVAAVLCEASFVLVSQRISARIKPIRLSLVVAALSLLFVLPFAAPSIFATDWTAVSPAIWALAVWYALSASVFCTIFWYTGAGHVEPWVAGLATAALPITAVTVAALALGEPLDAPRLAGGAMVVAAIVIAALSQRRSAAG